MRTLAAMLVAMSLAFSLVAFWSAIGLGAYVPNTLLLMCLFSLQRWRSLPRSLALAFAVGLVADAHQLAPYGFNGLAFALTLVAAFAVQRYWVVRRRGALMLFAGLATAWCACLLQLTKMAYGAPSSEFHTALPSIGFGSLSTAFIAPLLWWLLAFIWQDGTNHGAELADVH